MSTPRMTEQELQEAHRRIRISKMKQKTVRGGAVRATEITHGPAPKATTVPNRRGSDRASKNRDAGIDPAPSPSFAPFQLVLTGQLPSGKNQVRTAWTPDKKRPGKMKPHKYPDKTFTNWRSRAHIEIEEQQLPAVRVPTITRPISLFIDYVPGDLRTRDVSGQLDALMHLLVYAKVLKDDGLVHNVTWRRQAMDRTASKVIVTLEAQP